MTLAPYFERDGIVLYNADCLDHADLWTSADVLVTDPPYGIAWRKHGGGRGGKSAGTPHGGIANDDDTSTRDRALAVFGDRPAAVFGSFAAPFPAGVKQVLVWRKPPDAGVLGTTTGYRRDAEPVFLCGKWPMVTVRWSSVLDPCATGIGAVASAAGHPHAKPVPLMRTLIERCPPGVVVDPFAGSGSTLVACAELRRPAIGFELDEGYCEIAAERIGRALDQGSLFPAEHAA